MRAPDIVLLTAMAFAAAGLPSAALHAQPAPVPATPASTDARMAAARDLAKLVNPTSRVEEQIGGLLANMARQAFTTDPSLTALGQEYPGSDRVFVETIRPIMTEELERTLPAYIEATASFFAGNFTQAELGELLAFWRSPAGQVLVDSVSSAADYSSMTKEIVDQISVSGADFSISQGAISKDKQKAAMAGISRLSPAQQTAVIRFGLTPTGRKLARLAPQRNEIDRQWANREPSAEAMARMEKEIPEALLAFMAAEDRKRAAAP
jgi:hypothetical protein